MLSTGHPTTFRIAGLVLFAAGSFLEAADPTPTTSPTPAAVRRELHLGEYADRATLERDGTTPPEGAVVITNETVGRLGEGGHLTICTPDPRPTAGSSWSGSTATPVPTAVRNRWRRRVEAQNQRIVEAERELARIDARIEALEDAAFDGGSRAYRLWARLDEARARRRIAEVALRRERTKLSSIMRDARKEGAQPGWFR
jgi:hypothetical protein